MKVLANDGIATAGKIELEEAGFTVVTDTVPQEDLIEIINKEKALTFLMYWHFRVKSDTFDIV